MRSKKQPEPPVDMVRLPEDGFPWLVFLSVVQEYSPAIGDVKPLFRIAFNRDLKGLEELVADFDLQSMSEVVNRSGLSYARLMYQVSSLLRKFRFPSDVAVQTENAARAFALGEEDCRRINRSYLKTRTIFGDRVFQDTAKLFIAQILGPCPHITEFEESKHGPKACVGSRQYTDSYFKYQRLPYLCPPRALGLARSFILADERWCRAINAVLHICEPDEDVRTILRWNWHKFERKILKACDTNGVSLVPKDRKTFRTIAAEPCMGMFLSQGVSSWIRRRLKGFGIDLNTQCPNQEAAKRGSVDGSIATIDLSRASDCISLALVYELLPKDWRNLCWALRSDYGKFPGVGAPRVKYEKFSSMGNGYTFAIETLLFFAITATALRFAGVPFECGKTLSVYGDDIIVPSAGYGPTVAALTEAGFTVNDEKSFFEGPIRESCGTECFLGTSVRPIYLRRVPTSPLELIALRNRLWMRVVDDGCSGEYISSLFDRWIPNNWPSGPVSEDHLSSWVFRPGRRYKRRGWCTYNRALIARIIPWSGKVNGYVHLLKAKLKAFPMENNPWDDDDYGPKGAIDVSTRDAWDVIETQTQVAPRSAGPLA